MIDPCVCLYLGQSFLQVRKSFRYPRDVRIASHTPLGVRRSSDVDRQGLSIVAHIVS